MLSADAKWSARERKQELECTSDRGELLGARSPPRGRTGAHAPRTVPGLEPPVRRPRTVRVPPIDRLLSPVSHYLTAAFAVKPKAGQGRKTQPLCSANVRTAGADTWAGQKQTSLPISLTISQLQAKSYHREYCSQYETDDEHGEEDGGEGEERGEKDVVAAVGLDVARGPRDDAQSPLFRRVLFVAARVLIVPVEEAEREVLVARVMREAGRAEAGGEAEVDVDGAFRLVRKESWGRVPSRRKRSVGGRRLGRRCGLKVDGRRRLERRGP